MQPVIIRTQPWVTLCIGIFAGGMLLWYFFGPYDKTRILYVESPRLTVFLGVVFGGMLFYSLRELVLKKPEIILTEDGIEIRGKGWNHWDYIKLINISVEEDSENGNRVYLIVQLKDATEIKSLISDLNRSPGEILSLAREFKNNVSL